MKRGKTRRGGSHTIKKEGDKWYIYVGDRRTTIPYDSFEKAKEALAQAKASLTLVGMKKTGGAYTIRKEGDKWYVYRGEKKSSTPHNSFKEASQALKEAIGVVALKNMKGKGTRRHRKY